MPELDLSNLVIGGVSIAPIIFLVVQLVKRSGLLDTPNKVLAVVVGLAVLAYGGMLLSEAFPAIAPVLGLVLQLGQALLVILIGAGSSVAIHRGYRAAARKPGSSTYPTPSGRLNPYAEPPAPKRGRG